MRGLSIVALPAALLLMFAVSASAITDAELDAAKREAEYAKAKADIAEQQMRAAKANAERRKFEKDSPKAGADPAATSSKSAADPKKPPAK